MNIKIYDTEKFIKYKNNPVRVKLMNQKYVAIAEGAILATFTEMKLLRRFFPENKHKQLNDMQNTNNKTLISVYGSLKKGHHNHNLFLRFPKEDWIFQGVETIQGFNLFPLGGFPGIEHGDNQLVIEKYLVSDNVLARVRGLEGYDPTRPHSEQSFYDEIDIETTSGISKVYLFVSGAQGRDIITNGDWNEYCGITGLTEKDKVYE